MQNIPIKQFIVRLHVILCIFGVNNLVLAFHDQSYSLDLTYGPIPFTFRSWLWINFVLSVLSIIAILKVFQFNLQIQSATSIQFNSILFLWTSKILSTIIGFGLYLSLNFESTHDCVLVYCGLEFLSYGILLGPILRKIYKD